MIDSTIDAHAPYGVSPRQEAWVRLANNFVVAFDGKDPAGTSYVRVLAPDGGEVVYFVSTEWAEDPECVMGALCGAMMGHRRPEPDTPDVYYQFGPDSIFPDGISYEVWDGPTQDEVQKR